MQDHSKQEINVKGNVCSRQNNEIGHVNGLLDPGERSENRNPVNSVTQSSMAESA